MGTRSTLTIKEDGVTLARLYRQYDGSPHFAGADIANALRGRKIVNGFGIGDTIEDTFNGAGCLAPYLIGQLKGSTLGNIYMMNPGSPLVEQEFNYIIDVNNGFVRFTCYEEGERIPLFDGTVDDFFENVLNQPVAV